MITAFVPLNSLFDPASLLNDLGGWALFGIIAMVFVESGLLFPFLPGDSLLFVAGMLHVQLGIAWWQLVLFAWIAAVAGDTVGYWIGEQWGRRLFKPDAKILKTKYLDEAEAFFAKYGGRSIILARFVPIVRTFIPVAVGATKYPYGKFVSFNVLGGLTWVLLMVLAGTFLGGVPFIANNVDLITVGIVALSLIPVALQVYKSIRESKQAKKAADSERFPNPDSGDRA